MILRLGRLAIDLARSHLRREPRQTPAHSGHQQQALPEARKLQDDTGLHQILYRFSPDDYKRISEIWRGPHPEDGSELRVVDGPPQGAPAPDLDEEPQLTAPVGPDLDPEYVKDGAKRIFGT